MTEQKLGKAIFLDRDGVINREIGTYVKNPDEFILNDGVIDALKKFRSLGYLLIVITNQGGIAKGLYTEHGLELIHEKLKNLLSESGIILDEIYYCPHHPLVSNCICRKPGSLLLEKAIARFQLNASACYFIGDRERDVEAAKQAGVIPIHIISDQRIDTLDFLNS